MGNICKKIIGLILLFCLILIPLGRCIITTVIIRDDFTGDHYQSVNPVKWTYIHDDEYSNISLLNNQLFTGGGVFDGDTDIIELKRHLNVISILNIAFNYSRYILVSGGGGSFYCTAFKILFNSTYYLSISEYGMVSGGQITSDILGITLVNGTDIKYISVNQIYWYTNCLNNTQIQIMLLSYSTIPNIIYLTINYYNSSGVGMLVMHEPYLVGNFSDFEIAVQFETKVQSITSSGGTTIFDNFILLYNTREVEQKEFDYLLWISITFLLIGSGGVVVFYSISRRKGQIKDLRKGKPKKKRLVKKTSIKKQIMMKYKSKVHS